MAKYRQGRINDEMQKVLADVVREIKDPRVSGAFVSITGAEVTPDLKYAKIYYSALKGEPKEVAAGLKSAAGFARRQVAEKMNLRVTPELTFVADNSIRYGAHIASLLETIAVTPAEETGEGETNGNEQK